MASRAIWKGTIGFGLVQIPVDLVTAEDRSESLSFTLLDQRNMAKVGYERVNKETGEKVPWEEVVKGYELESGEFVVLNDSDFLKANVEATQTIDIQQFVDAKEVDWTYCDKPYYLRATKKGLKAYALLRDTLADEGKVGVATVVIRTRQHVALVVPHGEALVLEILRYADELRGEDDLDLPSTDLSKLHVTKAERDMAKQLVEGMTQPLDLSAYHDEYREDVLRVIHEKAERGEVNVVTEEEEVEKPARPREVDLMAMLKRSIEERGEKKAPKKKAASTTKKRPATKKKVSRKKAA
jgi:DNA end-binding protein Ku